MSSSLILAEIADVSHLEPHPQTPALPSHYTAGLNALLTDRRLFLCAPVDPESVRKKPKGKDSRFQESADAHEILGSLIAQCEASHPHHSLRQVVESMASSCHGICKCNLLAIVAKIVMADL